MCTCACVLFCKRQETEGNRNQNFFLVSTSKATRNTSFEEATVYIRVCARSSMISLKALVAVEINART